MLPYGSFDLRRTPCSGWTGQTVHFHRTAQSESEQELIQRTRSVLRAIQRSPERVRAYFRPEPVRYAA